jgi:hypothetical protein
MYWQRCWSYNYGAEHEGIVYETSPLPYLIARALIERVPITRLAEAKISQMPTLYVQLKKSVVDEKMVKRLDLAPNQ